MLHRMTRSAAGHVRVLDLTKPIGPELAIYSTGEYSDPPLELRDWCTVASQGYRVSAVSLGTQTGTHIDAPAHFDAGGATLDRLSVDRLIGRYFLVDLPARADAAAAVERCRTFSTETILFIRAPEDESVRMTAAALDALLDLPPRVWVADGAFEVEGAEELAFHRRLATTGVYLVEDLAREAARAVRPGGEVFALPLALVGTSGAPCRVVVRDRQGPTSSDAPG